MRRRTVILPALAAGGGPAEREASGARARRRRLRGTCPGVAARAYPARILIWHEIVNDTVGGVPVAVTYCPLCNSALAVTAMLTLLTAIAAQQF